MKKQNGFISSSSSVAVSYSSFYAGQAYDHTQVTRWTTTAKGNPYSIMTQLYDSYSDTQEYTWQTYQSNCYQRIQYFLQATQKLGQPYNKNGFYYQNITNYSSTVATEGIYNGFVDLVITLPCQIRLAGIQLINPWVSDRFDSTYSEYWKYLPCKFNIYKVNNKDENGDSILNDSLEQVTYQTDVANSVDYNKTKTLRPVKYNKIQTDTKMTLLGSYKNIIWKNLSSYKCFFKYNPDDQASVNVGVNTGTTGTATWECKQLVIRIFQTKSKLVHLNIKDPSSQDENTYIKQLIYQYILQKQLSYGTTYAGLDPSISQIKQLYGLQGISSSNNPTDDANWKFGSQFIRSYKYVKDLKFKSGIQYKLGGIQLLISPDIFSVSQMKMYNYAGQEANKVYIGQYDPDFNDVYYYGAKNVRQSPYIDIDQNSQSITWRHNFNIPANYLDAKVFIRFNMNYDSFNVGDVVSNVVNVQNAPLSMKVTNNQVSVSLANGIGFLNPTSGQFMSFQNGIGIQMDRSGNYDAFQAAVDVGAKIIDAGSSVAASITGGCPFQLYFVIKRLY